MFSQHGMNGFCHASRGWVTGIALTVCAFRAAAAQPVLTPADIDPAAAVEWAAGRAAPCAALTNGAWIGAFGVTNGPAGFFFGNGASGGPRHFRAGFAHEVALGTVATRGWGRLSVLRPEAVYPGDPAKESDWLPAERVREAQISFWVLPPGTRTRALRWSAEGKSVAEACPDAWADATVTEGLAGWFGGLYAFAERLADVTSLAEALPLTPGEDPQRLTGGSYRIWRGFGGWRPCWEVWETDRSRWNGKDAAPPLAFLLMWPKPVTVSRLALCFPGVSEARADLYAGPSGTAPREAAETAWRELARQGVASRYPSNFDAEWLTLTNAAAGTALRVTGLAPLKREAVHPDVARQISGRRAWFGCVAALAALGDRPLAEFLAALTEEKSHPPIPVNVTLPRAGFVTLVIEDAKGDRVRNLISETPLPAGPSTVWWDGLDDHRAKNVITHGAYEVDGQPVEPGEYRVRGLYRGPIDLRYEFTVYNPVNPPWRTPGRDGQWLSDHRPPSDVLFVPGEKPFMLIGSKVAEAGHGLVWTDLDGHKIVGLTALGGWAGAANLAYDAGPKRDTSVDAYAVAVWDNTLYVRAVQGQSVKMLLRPDFAFSDEVKAEHGVGGWRTRGIAGLAAYNGMVIVSTLREGGLLVVDTTKKPVAVAGKIPLDDPRGVAFASDGALFCATSNRVLRFAPFGADKLPQPSEAVVLVKKDLEDACGIALDPKGCLYVSDRGTCHQVKVFSSKGRLVRTIGKAGQPALGPYDERRMNNPAGLTVTSRDELWVAEEDFQPKRVSVWSTQGKFIRAFYGPSRYGGGGHLDPRDKSRFYYEGMEFKLDWEKGSDRLVNVYHRPERNRLVPRPKNRLA